MKWSTETDPFLPTRVDGMMMTLMMLSLLWRMVIVCTIHGCSLKDPGPSIGTLSQVAATSGNTTGHPLQAAVNMRVLVLFDDTEDYEDPQSS